MYLDRTNKLSYTNFCEIFQFSKNYEWPRRIFDMINKKLTGFVSLDEFFIFCLHYLVIDAETTRQFCFRLLSRRAGTADDNTILDMQDIKTFIKFAYKIKRNQADKIATEIFEEMDASGNFGLALPEFTTYSQRNPTFLVFGHTFLTHFRMCLFGFDFWVKRSRKLKKKRAVGFGSFVRLKNANNESEELARKLTKRGTVNVAAASHEGKKKSKDEKGAQKKRRTTTRKTENASGGKNELPAIDESAQEQPAEDSAAPIVQSATQRRGSVFDRFVGPPSSGRSRRRSILEVFKGEGNGYTFTKKRLGEKNAAPKVGVGPDGTVGEEFYDEDDDVEEEETDESRRARLQSLVFHDTYFDFIK